MVLEAAGAVLAGLSAATLARVADALDVFNGSFGSIVAVTGDAHQAQVAQDIFRQEVRIERSLRVREDIRDAHKLMIENVQTQLLMGSIVLGICFTVLIEGRPSNPADAPALVQELWAVFGIWAISLSFLSVWFALQFQEIVSVSARRRLLEKHRVCTPNDAVVGRMGGLSLAEKVAQLHQRGLNELTSCLATRIGAEGAKEQLSKQIVELTDALPLPWQMAGSKGQPANSKSFTSVYSCKVPGPLASDKEVRYQDLQSLLLDVHWCEPGQWLQPHELRNNSRQWHFGEPRCVRVGRGTRAWLDMEWEALHPHLIVDLPDFLVDETLVRLPWAMPASKERIPLRLMVRGAATLYVAAQWPPLDSRETFRGQGPPPGWGDDELPALRGARTAFERVEGFSVLLSERKMDLPLYRAALEEPDSSGWTKVKLKFRFSDAFEAPIIILRRGAVFTSEEDWPVREFLNELDENQPLRDHSMSYMSNGLCNLLFAAFFAHLGRILTDRPWPECNLEVVFISLALVPAIVVVLHTRAVMRFAGLDSFSPASIRGSFPPARETGVAVAPPMIGSSSFLALGATHNSTPGVRKAAEAQPPPPKLAPVTQISPISDNAEANPDVPELSLSGLPLSSLPKTVDWDARSDVSGDMLCCVLAPTGAVQAREVKDAPDALVPRERCAKTVHSCGTGAWGDAHAPFKEWLEDVRISDDVLMDIRVDGGASPSSCQGAAGSPRSESGGRPKAKDAGLQHEAGDLAGPEFSDFSPMTPARARRRSVCSDVSDDASAAELVVGWPPRWCRPCLRRVRRRVPLCQCCLDCCDAIWRWHCSCYGALLRHLTIINLFYYIVKFLWLGSIVAIVLNRVWPHWFHDDAKQGFMMEPWLFENDFWSVAKVAWPSPFFAPTATALTADGVLWVASDWLLVAVAEGGFGGALEPTFSLPVAATGLVATSGSELFAAGAATLQRLDFGGQELAPLQAEHGASVLALLRGATGSRPAPTGPGVALRLPADASAARVGAAAVAAAALPGDFGWVVAVAPEAGGVFLCAAADILDLSNASDARASEGGNTTSAPAAAASLNVAIWLPQLRGARQSALHLCVEAGCGGAAGEPVLWAAGEGGCLTAIGLQSGKALGSWRWLAGAAQIALTGNATHLVAVLASSSAAAPMVRAAPLLALLGASGAGGAGGAAGVGQALSSPSPNGGC